MKWFFILGRNPELSRMEVLEFFKARGRSHREVLFEENFLVLETGEGEKFSIQEFGGVMWLGEITYEGNDPAEYLDSGEIVPADKFSYAVFGNVDPEELKDRFKERKKKAMIKHGGKQIEFQGGEKQDLPNADFNIFFHEYEDVVYFGLATQSYDNFQVKKRDMGKPVRRESLAISPRLAKILINLSGAKPRSLLLDPFCGIGGILQEAMIKGINVHGIDKDKQATVDAVTNLDWIESEYKTGMKYTIQFKDSVRAPDLQFSGIATETPLGVVLRKRPSDNQAKKIIQDFEALIIPILRRLKSVKKPTANIAITFPTIRDFHVDSEKISKKTGLRLYIGPILESRKDQFISRDIVVFS